MTPPAAGHTPGPWSASCDRDEKSEANSIFATVCGHEVVIAAVFDDERIRQKYRGGREFEYPGDTAGPDALDEVDANARLIAAAPDLLAACKAVHDRGAPHGDGDLYKLLDDAISKAGGAA